MFEIDRFLQAVLEDSTDASARASLREALIASGSWNGPTTLRYVLEHPEADGPRLLAADWLGSHARAARAEFIRVQCRLARLLDVLGGGSSTRPDVARLLLAEQRLADDLEDRLSEGMIPPRRASRRGAGGEHFRVSGGCVALDYVRGFVERAELTSLEYFEHAANLFRNHPVAVVRLLDKAPARVADGWRWLSICADPTDPADRIRYLPPSLYQLLDRNAADFGRSGTVASPPTRTYPSLSAALAALSAACVAHGRFLARRPTPDESA